MMAVIDCHFHIWDLKKFKYQFPTKEHGSFYRDITLDEYVRSTSGSPIKHAIFMQVEPEVAVQEAEWVLEQAKENTILKGIVAGFKLEDPNLASILDKFKDEKLFLGVRNILEYHEQDDWILSDDAIRGMSLLVDRGIPYHVLCNMSKHWKYIPDLLKKFPHHKFVIDHMGKPVVMEEIRPGWDEWIAEVAKYPNVYCKLSSQFFPHRGPLTEKEKRGEFTEDQKKYVKKCVEVFGVDRCMFASDWPVCGFHGLTSATDMYVTAQALLSHLSDGERQKIFGGNCAKFYNLNLQ